MNKASSKKKPTKVDTNFQTFSTVSTTNSPTNHVAVLTKRSCQRAINLQIPTLARTHASPLKNTMLRQYRAYLNSPSHQTSPSLAAAVAETQELQQLHADLELKLHQLRLSNKALHKQAKLACKLEHQLHKVRTENRRLSNSVVTSPAVMQAMTSLQSQLDAL